jgi:hypothetical protein
MHLVKHIEELAIWEIKILAATVEYDDYPASVAAVAILDCLTEIA